MAKRGVYIAVTSDGDVYGGQSSDLSRRSNQHKHSGKDVIAEFEVPTSQIMRSEHRLISFLRSQAQEEDFNCINRQR